MFMYDPDLAKFGNAVSPIVPVESDRYAQLAMQRPFADRYNPRYDQPDATDWMMMALAEEGDTYVGAPARTAGAFESLSEKTGIAGGTAVALLLIVGTSGLLAARNPKHVVEIGLAGAAGVALALAINTKKLGGLR